MSVRVPYDEFSYFADNAAEFGLPYEGPPVVRRADTTTPDGRPMSALVWGAEAPRLVLIHGGAQNAHTWDTVALALDTPLVAVDLPGHGHSGPVAGTTTDRTDRVEALAADVAAAIDELAPNAEAVVGMSLGGLTSIALAAARPDLVRRLVLVDITPGLNSDKTKAITDFVNGPASFASLDELLERTMQFNPTRSESSLRRGILHNAVQLDDGSWRWRYRRFDEAPPIEAPTAEDRAKAASGEPAGAVFGERLWSAIERLDAPLLFVRGMREQSVVTDEDEAELLRRRPTARVEHFAEAGHSVQGDMPVELAHVIQDFVATT